MRRRLGLMLMLVLVLTLAACGGDEEAPATATGDTGAGATGGTGAGGCVDLTSGDMFTLTISGFAFEPDCLTARAAQSIAIVNQDAADHTFTIDGTMVDVTIPAGETFNGEPVTGVVEPGTYGFRCRFHPSMTGTITVE